LADVKAKYHELAMRYHPDRSKGGDARFKEVNRAYQLLKDGKYVGEGPTPAGEHSTPRPGHYYQHQAWAYSSAGDMGASRGTFYEYPFGAQYNRDPRNHRAFVHNRRRAAESNQLQNLILNILKLYLFFWLAAFFWRITHPPRGTKRDADMQILHQLAQQKYEGDRERPAPSSNTSRLLREAQ